MIRCLMSLVMMLSLSSTLFAQSAEDLLRELEEDMKRGEKKTEAAPSKNIPDIPTSSKNPNRTVTSTDTSSSPEPKKGGASSPLFKADGNVVVAAWTTSYLDYGLSGGVISFTGWKSLEEVRPKGVLYESFRLTYGATMVRGEVNFPKWEVGVLTPTIGFSYLAVANLGKKQNDLMFMVGGSVGYVFQIGPNADPKRQDFAFTLSLDFFFPNAVLFDGWNPLPHLSCVATYTPMDDRWMIKPTFEVMVFFTKDVGMIWRMFEAMIEHKPTPYDVGQLTVSSTPMFGFPSVFGAPGKSPMLLASFTFGWTWDYLHKQDGYTWTLGVGMAF